MIYLYKYKIGDNVRFNSHSDNNTGFIAKRFRRGFKKYYNVKQGLITHGNVPENEVYEKLSDPDLFV
jgi:hypothetical protein